MKKFLLVLALTLGGGLAGLGVSQIVTPRYRATALLAVTDTERDHTASETFSLILPNVLNSETLSMLVQNPQIGAYEEERKRMPLEEVIAKARASLEVSPVTNTPTYRTWRLSFTGREARGTLNFVYGMITQFMSRYSMSRRNPMPDERLKELQARVAALEDKVGIAHSQEGPPGLRFSDFGLAVLDPPVVRREFPHAGYFLLTGAALGLLSSVFAVRRP